MASILGLGVVAMVLADAVVGARLLLLARRTRALPELLLGLSFLLLGAIGYPLSIVARRGLVPDDALAGWLLAGALGAQDLASLGIYVTTWRVFRPDARWAGAISGLAAAAFAASLAGHALTVGFAGARDGGVFYYLGFLARAAAFAWAAVEAFLYHDRIKRRVPLSLADPVVADRFRLWGIATTAIFVGFAAFLAGRLSGPNVAESPAVLGVTSLAGVVSGAGIWLAFFPPAAYARRLAGARGASTS